MPPVHQQSTLQHLWRRVYNLRLHHLDKDIIIYKDDLVFAFHRIFYHPDVAVAYAFVLSAYLVIPVGMVFGSRYAPSPFCFLSKMISFEFPFSHRLPLSRPTTSMIDQVSFPHASPSSRDINPAHKDPMNWGVGGNKMGPHPTFANDTIMAEVRYIIRQVDGNSFLTASVLIGNSNIVEEPISIENFERFFTHLN